MASEIKARHSSRPSALRNWKERVLKTRSRSRQRLSCARQATTHLDRKSNGMNYKSSKNTTPLIPGFPELKALSPLEPLYLPPSQRLPRRPPHHLRRLPPANSKNGLCPASSVSILNSTFPFSLAASTIPPLRLHRDDLIPLTHQIPTRKIPPRRIAHLARKGCTGPILHRLQPFSPLSRLLFRQVVVEDLLRGS